MPHPITEPMRQQQQKIATRLPAPPSLLALGPDEYDWDDQFTIVTNSPSLAGATSATGRAGNENRISSSTATSTKYHSSASKNNNTSAIIFSEDEDDALPLHHFGNNNSSGFGTSATSKLSSLFPLRSPTSLSSSSNNGNGGFMDPMLSSPAYHCFQAENALSTLKQVVRDDGWKKALKHKSGVVVHMKNGVNKADKTPLFKGQAIIQGFSPQSIFYVIGMRRLWDENFEDGNLIENLNETTSLTYEVTKAMATSKPRDLSLIEKIECTHDGAIIFACTSVESPRIPKIPGRVRAQIKLQGWILEPIRGSATPATRVTFVVQENMKGWVPGFAKKSLARRPLAIAAINDYLQKKADRMRSQKNPSQPVSRPSVFGTKTAGDGNTLEPPPLASKKPHRILTQQHALPSQQSSESSSMIYNPSPTSSQRSSHSQRSILVDQTTTYSMNNGSQRKHITFADNSDVSDREPDDVPVPSPTISRQQHQQRPMPSQQQPQQLHQSQSQQQSEQQPPPQQQEQQQQQPRRHLYPSHRHPNKKTESIDLLKRLSSSLDGWTNTGENDGVKLYIKTLSDRSSLPYLRGDGIIEGGWTAEQLCSLVHCYGARKVWDERFENGRVVERFSQKEYLVHWSLRNMFPITNCDISAITSIETNSTNGTIYTASMSVNDPMTNNTSGLRGHTDLYGWVFSPNLDDRGRTKSVNITMVCNMDYKCHVPHNAAQVLQDELLASIPNLNKYLQKYGCPPYIRRVAGKVVEENFETKTGSYQVSFIAKHEPSHAYRQRKSGWCTDIRVHKSVYSGQFDIKVSPTGGTRVEMTSDHKSIRIYTTSSEMEGKRVVVLLTTDNRRTKTNGVEKESKPVLPKPIKIPSEAKEEKERVKVQEKPEQSVSSSLSTQHHPEDAPTAATEPTHETSGTTATMNEQAEQQQQKQQTLPVSPTSPSHSLLNNPLHPLQSIGQTLPPEGPVPMSPTQFSHISTASGTLQVPKGYMLVPQSHQNNNIIIISDELTFNGQQLAVVFLAMVLCYYMGKFACTCS